MSEYNELIKRLRELHPEEFGDAWDSPFQYEDKDGTIVGCYIDRHYIEKTDREYLEHLERIAEDYFDAAPTILEAEVENG